MMNESCEGWRGESFAVLCFLRLELCMRLCVFALGVVFGPSLSGFSVGVQVGVLRMG